MSKGYSVESIWDVGEKIAKFCGSGVGDMKYLDFQVPAFRGGGVVGAGKK